MLEPEQGGGYHIYAPSLKGCHSYGSTKEEALKNIAEAISLWLESARELGIPISERSVGWVSADAIGRNPPYVS